MATGRPKGSGAAQRKEKLSLYYESVLEAAEPKTVLKALLTDCPIEFMRQFISLLPKEQKVDMTVNPFEGRTIKELNYYIQHQKWPEDK